MGRISTKFAIFPQKNSCKTLLRSRQSRVSFNSTEERSSRRREQTRATENRKRSSQERRERNSRGTRSGTRKGAGEGTPDETRERSSEENRQRDLEEHRRRFPQGDRRGNPQGNPKRDSRSTQATGCRGWNKKALAANGMTEENGKRGLRPKAPDNSEVTTSCDLCAEPDLRKSDSEGRDLEGEIALLLCLI